MGKVYRLKILGIPIYVATIPQAVVDPESGESVKEAIASIKTNKVDKTSIVGVVGQDETKVMSQKAVTEKTSELALADAEHSSQIKNIENVLSTANINQATTLSIMGRKTISLPKNASNGGMIVKMEGLTAENIVVNGDFRNGTSGWTPINADRDLFTLQQNGLKITCGIETNTTDLATYVPVGHFIAGNKYYIALFIDDYLQVLGGAGFSLRHYVSGSYIDIASLPLKKGLTSVVATSGYTSSATKYLTLRGVGSLISPEDFYVIKHSIVLNLTATFGAGNEPTKEQCDLMFSDYFEGVKSFEPTGRVRSVGKNLFNRTKVLRGKYIIPATGLANNALFVASDYIEIETATAYKLQGVTAKVSTLGETTVGYYDVNKTYISGQLIALSTLPAFITPSTAKYLIFTMFPPDIYTAQLERGTVSTPYRETSLYLTAPELRSNGTVKDEIRKGANGYELVKRVGVGTLGPEMITVLADRDFSSDTGWWQKLTGTIIANGIASFTGSGSLYGTSSNWKINRLYTSNFLKINTPYQIKFKARGLSATKTLYVGTGYKEKQVAVTDVFAEYTVDMFTGDINTSATIAFGGPLNNQFEIDDVTIKEIVTTEGTALYNNLNFTKLSDGTILYTLSTPAITPISYGGILNSAESGTVYHEQVIADAGVYDTKMDILLTDYPISAIEEIIKHENGVDTYLNATTAVIASDGLSFTHPDLASGDLVLFTYAYGKESTNGNITATYYDSNVVKIDTVTGKAYKITDVVTNGVLSRTLTEI